MLEPYRPKRPIYNPILPTLGQYLPSLDLPLVLLALLEEPLELVISPSI